MKDELVRTADWEVFERALGRATLADIVALGIAVVRAQFNKWCPPPERPSLDDE